MHPHIVATTKQDVLHNTFDLLINMVFNADTTSFPMENKMSDDKKLIEDLGGPTKVCELLGYEKHGGVQRVQNWLARGIPPKVKLERPDLFLGAPAPPEDPRTPT